MAKLLNKAIIKTLLFVIPIWILISTSYQAWFPNILFPIVWPFIMPGFLLYIFTGGSVHSVSYTFVIIANYIINFVSIFIIVFYAEHRRLKKREIQVDNKLLIEEYPSKLFRIIYIGNMILIGLAPIYALLKGLGHQNDDYMRLSLKMMLVYYDIPLLMLFLFLNIWRAKKFKINRVRYIIIASTLLPIIILGLYMAEEMSL